MNLNNCQGCFYTLCAHKHSYFCFVAIKINVNPIHDGGKGGRKGLLPLFFSVTSPNLGISLHTGVNL